MHLKLLKYFYETQILQKPILPSMAFEYLAALETMIFTVCPKNKSADVLSYEHNLFKISKLREKTTARCFGLYIVLKY